MRLPPNRGFRSPEAGVAAEAALGGARPVEPEEDVDDGGAAAGVAGVAGGGGPPPPPPAGDGDGEGDVATGTGAGGGGAGPAVRTSLRGSRVPREVSGGLAGVPSPVSCELGLWVGEQVCVRMCA